MNLAGKNVLILGLGESGLAMARWCAFAGARVRVADSRTAPPALAALRQDLPEVQAHCGELNAALLGNAELVLRSPGIAPHAAEFRPIVEAASERGTPVAGELQLFAWALTDLRASRGYTPKVVAITGTNGKTTVTRMVGQMLERAGWSVAVAGNISPAMLDVLREAVANAPPIAEPAEETVESSEAIAEDGVQAAEGDDEADAAEQPDAADTTDAIDAAEAAEQAEFLAAARAARAVAEANAHLPQAWVLELSSFQLHGVEDFSADAATVLNVTQDHLDWHGGMAAYAADKARIFGGDAARGVVVLNSDDAAVAAMVRVGRRLRRFGLRMPTQHGDWGVLREAGMDWLARALPDVEAEAAMELAAAKPNRRGRASTKTEPAPLRVQRLMPVDVLRVQGAHNVANALAALALGDAVNAPLAPMLHALRDYQGEPHRMQIVAVVDDVRWIDDSKGTNVGATAAALAGMNAPVVLIAGGDGKGQDFSPLRTHAARLRAAVLIGRDAQAIAAVLEGAAPVYFAETLPEAVQRAAELARAGDAGLLSPACASLDMFRNYAHRAEVFADAVRDLAESRGQIWTGAMSADPVAAAPVAKASGADMAHGDTVAGGAHA